MCRISWFRPECFWRNFRREAIKQHSAHFPANPHFGRTFWGKGRETERSVLWRQTELQRGIRKDLWPKYFPKCPVARHFVCPREKHVGCHPLTHWQHVWVEHRVG